MWGACVGRWRIEVKYVAEVPPTWMTNSMECNDDVKKLNWFDRHGRKRINRVINGLNVGNARSRAKLYSSKNLENWEMVV